MDHMSVRLSDIAERAQVSLSTVSLVLNGKQGVGEARRIKILSIAREMGYRGPKTKSHISENTVSFLHISRHGQIVNRDHDVFISDYIEGLSKGCESEGLNLNISTFIAEPIDKIVNSLLDVDAGGFIVLGTELSESEAEVFKLIQKPVVFIDAFYKYQAFDFVDMNNEDSVHLVVNEFISKGHRKIGIITASPETPNIKLRLEEFKASMLYFGLVPEEKYCFSVRTTFHGAYADMLSLLGKSRELPTALFCINDLIACGCLRAFKEKGYRIPQDISLIGFDDIPLASVSNPPLTTVSVSKVRIGAIAARILKERLTEGASLPYSKVSISGELIKRSSVATLSRTS